MVRERDVYRALSWWNDIKAVLRAVRTGSPEPIVRRAARKVYWRQAGRLGRRI